MQWSKLRTAIEGLFAPAMQGRLELHSARYSTDVSSMMARAWITWDKQEILNISTASWLAEYRKLVHQIRTINQCTNFTDPNQRAAYDAASDEAKAILHTQGRYSREEYFAALQDYLSVSIDDALQSSNTIIKALALVDRRVGKRRLQQMAPEDFDHPLVRRLYQLRCEAEGIQIATRTP